MKLPIALNMLLLIFTLPIQTVNASSLDFQVQTIHEEGVLSEGVLYKNYSAKTYTDYGTEGLQNISTIEMSGSLGYEIVTWSKLGDNSIIKSNMIEIAQDFEENNPGYEVLAGVNGDYYNMSNGTPINALVQDGNVIKYSNFNLERYFSVGFTNDERQYITNKTNQIESSFSLSIFDDEGMQIREFQLKGLNTIPRDGETSVYYKSLGSLVVNNATMIEGTVEKAINYDSSLVLGTIIGETQEVSNDSEKFTIVTKNDVVKSYMKSGHEIRIQKNISGVYENVDSIIGVGSQPLLNSVIKDFEDIKDQNVDFAKARSPRSSFGFTPEGDFIIATFDGRQENMAGVNLREMSFAMSELGCSNAFNLDGGGSTQLVIKDSGSFRMLNSPSQVPYRNVSNGILIVKPKVNYDLQIFDETSNSFNIEFTINNPEEVANYELFVDGTSLTYTGGVSSVQNLMEKGTHFVNVKVTLKSGDIYTSSHEVELDEYTSDDDTQKNTIPSDFIYTINDNQDINGFNVNIEFNDDANTFVKMYLVIDNEKKLAKKTVNGYSIQYNDAEEGREYLLELEVYYVSGGVAPEVFTPDEKISYLYKTVENTPGESTNDDDIYNIVLGAIVIAVTIGFVTIIIKKK